jgi:hypothetical protein
MTDLYEFKIRIEGDDRKWEDMGEYDRRRMQRPDAALYAKKLVTRYETIKEVRYNVSGSLQGHYVS